MQMQPQQIHQALCPNKLWFVSPCQCDIIAWLAEP